MYDIDVEDERQQMEKQRANRNQDIADITWLMKDHRGRRIVTSLFQSCGVFRMSYTGEPLSTAFNEGKRNIGNELLVRITQACPDMLAELLQEFNQDGRSTNNESRATSREAD